MVLFLFHKISGEKCFNYISWLVDDDKTPVHVLINWHKQNIKLKEVEFFLLNLINKEILLGVLLFYLAARRIFMFTAISLPDQFFDIFAISWEWPSHMSYPQISTIKLFINSSNRLPRAQ
jgi:hypothetical protein